MKNILIISYAFPPALTGGTWRAFKFAKYLPSYGVHVDVMTTTTDNYEKEDYEILNQLDEQVKIYRKKPLIRRKTMNTMRQNIVIKAGENLSDKNKISLIQKLLLFIRNVFLIPDADILWSISTLPKIVGLIKKNKYDAVFCTSPPPSVLLIGLLIKMITGVKLIIDYRDPWTQWFDTVSRHENNIRKKAGYFIEKKLVKRSDIIIGTTNSIVEYLKNVTVVEKNKFHVIFNGVDPDDFNDIQPKKLDKRTLVYTGLLNESFYSPENIFKVLAIIKKEMDNLDRMFQFVILGKADKNILNMIVKYGIEDLVKYKGYRSHKETLSYIKGADQLLLLLNPGITDYLTISGKIFEYLFSENPILAIIPDKSAAGEILKDYSRAKIIDPNALNDLKSYIIDWLTGILQSKELASSDYKLINKFNRKEQSNQLSKIIKII